MIPMLAALVGGYLLGSIPFGFILSRMAGLGDIRAIGSGSIGATNVLRTGRKDIAALTVLLDGGKGTLAVLLAAQFSDPLLPLIAGCAAVVGHCTTIWLGGRGGKGVATGAGTLLGWAWPAGVLVCVLWLLAAFATKRSSVAALVACAAAPFVMLAFRPFSYAVAALLLSLFIIARHHGNIRRLLAGTEPRIGAGK